MATQAVFDANQIVGKTLYAAKPVPVYRLPNDKASPFNTVDVGGAVGTVFSYVLPDASKDRTAIYWQFHSRTGGSYWAKQRRGAFSITALKNQGAMTVEEIEKQKKLDDLDFWEKAGSAVSQGTDLLGNTIRLAVFGAIAIGLVWASSK